MLAPMVALMRLPLMAAETRDAAQPGRTETKRAVTEKMAAMAEGACRADVADAVGVALLAGDLVRPDAVAAVSGVAAERSMHAALKPASRRVKANFKRLSAKADLPDQSSTKRQKPRSLRERGFAIETHGLRERNTAKITAPVRET